MTQSNRETYKSPAQFTKGSSNPPKTKQKSGKKRKGSKPKGPHGRAAVKALGRTKTTGNFKKIEAKEGKGAAIGAYQNALAKHQGRPAPYGKKSKSSGKEMLKKAMC